MTSSEQPVAARDALLHAARAELVDSGHAAVSLRAVARRAGVSHAAPAHFFRDRAGMLTAVAIEGFTELAQTLAAASQRATDGREPPLEALGLAYVEFGLAHPALMDLMFRRSELVADDGALAHAQARALDFLRSAVSDAVDDTAAAAEWSLVSWAVVHGLVSLVREGVLARIAEQDPDRAPDLARRLVRVYGQGVAAMARE
jgi:AcrR family transcriptional regulator